MKKLLLILLLCSPCLASGPKYSFEDPKLNDELDNIYKDIGSNLSGDVRISSVTISTMTITNLKGATNGSNPCATCVGFQIRSAIDSGSTINCGTSNQYFDITSIVLTPGRWLLFALVGNSLNGATETQAGGCIGTATGNNGANCSTADTEVDGLPATAVTNVYYVVPGYYTSVSANTTIYLKGYCLYSAGTPKAFGRINAIRL